MNCVSSPLLLLFLLIAPYNHRNGVTEAVSFKEVKSSKSSLHPQNNSLMYVVNRSGGFSNTKFHRKGSSSSYAPKTWKLPHFKEKHALTRAMSTAAAPIRNVAIVAHVDHGKTTLVDALLAASNASISKLNQRLLDSNDQEKERGITIFSKNAALLYKSIKINIVDTPGHADFAGEVERVINMVEGVLLVVDSVEGPKAQTRFVLKKALAAGNEIIVVVNKVDRQASRPEYVVDKTFDLFVELNATDRQANFQVIYTSAINGQSGWMVDQLDTTMVPLLDAICQLPAPHANALTTQMLISDTEVDEFKGRLGIGKLTSGSLRKGAEVGIHRAGQPLRKGIINEVSEFYNIGKREIEEGKSGDIVIICGIPDLRIGDTIVDIKNPLPLPGIKIEEPTVRITIGVNKSPLVGKDSKSKFLTFEQIKERLKFELHKNVALKMEAAEVGDKVLISGRGQMHLTVLIEAMRREGFELLVGSPKIIEKMIDGVLCEPWEIVDVLIPESFMGSVMQEIQMRGSTIKEVEPTVTEESIMRLQFLIPTRNTIGLRTQLMTISRGRAIIESSPYCYLPKKLVKLKRDRGNLLATEGGSTTLHGIMHAQERGDVYIAPNVQVYAGMIIGVAHRSNDISLNVCRGKALNNFRSATKDKTETFIPPLPLTLERAIESIQDDEVVEVTPSFIRMAKTSAMK